MRQTIYIGIDPGTTTGVAVIVNGQYEDIVQCNIIKAMEKVKYWCQSPESYDICIHIENPSYRKYFGQTSRERLQGAGSIKRDYKIWSEFAEHHKLRLFPVSPASIGSTFDNEAVFKAATGYKKKCGIHARDAAKIIFKFKKS